MIKEQKNKDVGSYYFDDNKLQLSCGCWMKFDPDFLLDITAGHPCDYHGKKIWKDE